MNIKVSYFCAAVLNKPTHLSLHIVWNRLYYSKIKGKHYFIEKIGKVVHKSITLTHTYVQLKSTKTNQTELKEENKTNGRLVYWRQGEGNQYEISLTYSGGMM